MPGADYKFAGRHRGKQLLDGACLEVNPAREFLAIVGHWCALLGVVHFKLFRHKVFKECRSGRAIA